MHCSSTHRASVHLLTAFVNSSTIGTVLTGELISSDPGNPASPFTDGGISVAAASPTGYWAVNAALPLTGGVYTATANAGGFTKRDGTSLITDLPNIRLIKASATRE